MRMTKAACQSVALLAGASACLLIAGASFASAHLPNAISVSAPKSVGAGHAFKVKVDGSWASRGTGLTQEALLYVRPRGCPKLLHAAPTGAVYGDLLPTSGDSFKVTVAVSVGKTGRFYACAYLVDRTKAGHPFTVLKRADQAIKVG